MEGFLQVLSVLPPQGVNRPVKVRPRVKALVGGMEEMMDIMYGQDEQEFLSHDDPEECANDFFDDNPDCDMVIIYPYKRRVVDPKYSRVLDNMLEWLDDEYGGEDYTEPAEKMKEAERIFLESVISEYKVFQCEQCGPGITFERKEENGN